MAESVIQKRVSDPEFTTQTVSATVSLTHSGSGWQVRTTSATNVNSVSATGSSSNLTVTYDVAKSGYTLVGVTTIPAANATSSGGSSVAYFEMSSQNKHASVTVSGNTIVATVGSIGASTSGVMHLSSITCKYVKNN